VALFIGDLPDDMPLVGIAPCARSKPGVVHQRQQICLDSGDKTLSAIE